MACLLSADSALFKQYRRCYAKHIRPGVIVGVRYFTFEDGFFHGIFYFFDCRGGGYVEILHDFMTVDGRLPVTESVGIVDFAHASAQSRETFELAAHFRRILRCDVSLGKCHQVFKVGTGIGYETAHSGI